VRGVGAFLADLHAELKARRFVPLPARERQIPKPGGKPRRLGIATIRDRVAQAACKLVLEPIWEADVAPCSYGFRPGRRAQDAIEEVRYLAARSYEWVLEADITACFDEIDHSALMAQVRRRVGYKRVLALVKAFLKAGILAEDGAVQDTTSGTRKAGCSHRCSATWPWQCWTSMPLGHGRRWAPRPSATIGVSAGRPPGGWSAPRTIWLSWRPAPARAPRRATTRSRRCWRRWACACRKPRRGSAASTRGGLPRVAHPATPAASKHQALGLHLPVQDGPRGRQGEGAGADKAMPNQPLRAPLHRLNWVLGGWTTYFRHGSSSATLDYLRAFAWRQVVCW
jgi:RNA-directed DNA polymerase